MRPDLFAAMLAVGWITGFIGVGGAASVLAVLTAVFHVPVHLAIGTSLAAMAVTTVSGSIGHVREGNVDPAVGTGAALAGMAGSYLGAGLATGTNGLTLKVLTGIATWLAAALIFYRTRARPALQSAGPIPVPLTRVRRSAIGAAIGLPVGGLAGFLGFGAAAFFQLGILVTLRVPLRIAVGTTIMILAFVALSGASRFLQDGLVDWQLFLNIVLGTAVGAYAGSRCTRRAPPDVLRIAVVGWPLFTGALLIFS
ncbi:MAG: sulfite exporter TauE/SafE family protein [Chloroflexi bacterium]|nr:sulfite exporter TauE/SafE family protein [Chloroflexota bacterium]